MKPRFVFLGFSSVHVLWPLTNIVQRKNVLIKKCKINQIATIISCNKNTDLFDFIGDSGSLIYVIHTSCFKSELVEILRFTRSD